MPKIYGKKKKKRGRTKEMCGWGENACMEILSVGGSRIYERTSKAKEEFKEVHYWEVVISSRLACWERGSSRTTFSSQIASDHSAMRPPAGNEYLSLTGIEPVSSTWKDDVLTTGRKGPPFFIYLSSENRSGSFCFYTQFKIEFVFMLAISDVNSAGRPPFLRVPPPTQ